MAPPDLKQMERMSQKNDLYMKFNMLLRLGNRYEAMQVFKQMEELDKSAVDKVPNDVTAQSTSQQESGSEDSLDEFLAKNYANTTTKQLVGKPKDNRKYDSDETKPERHETKAERHDQEEEEEDSGGDPRTRLDMDKIRAARNITKV
jgi:hypothetical protein